MKRILIGVLLLLILVAAGAWWYLRQAPAFADRIPAQAEIVVAIDVKSIAGTLLTESLMNGDRIQAIRKSAGKQWGLGKSNTPPGDPGISLTQKAIVFGIPNPATGEKLWGVCAAIRDPASFNQMMNNQILLKEESPLLAGTYQLYWRADRETAFAWNDEFVAVIGRADSSTLFPYLREICSSQASLPSDIPMEQLLARTEEFAFWLTSPSTQSSTLGGISFEKGAITLLAELEGIQTDIACASTTEVIKFNLPQQSGYLNMDAVCIREGKTKLPETLQASKELDEFLEAWNGQMSFHVWGLQEVNKRFISYEYDEDFNKVEVVSSRKAQSPGFDIVVGLDASRQTQWLQAWETRGMISEIGSVKQLVQVLDFPLYLDSKAEHLLISTDSSRLSHTATTSESQLSSNQLLAIDIPLASLLPILPEAPAAGWKSISLEIEPRSSGSMQLTSQLSFEQQDANALIEVLDFLARQSPPEEFQR